jgi:hypothetical protein
MSLKARARIGRRVTVLGCCAALCAAALSASAQNAPPPFVNTPPYVLSAAIAPPAGVKITSFDISWVDPVRKRYYLANRTGKDIIVVDTTSNTLAGTGFTPGFTGFTGSNDTSGPDGVLTTESELYVGDAPSRVWALDPTTGAPIVAPISTSATSVDRADEGCYDPVHKVVAFVNNADSPPFLTFISTTTHSVLGQIVFDGVVGPGHGPLATDGAEQCQFNPRDERIYLSIPEINGDGTNNFAGGVVVIDPTTRQVVTTLGIGGIAPGTALTPTSPCTGPQGLAIGPAPQIGLGCGVGGTNTGGATNNAIIQDMTGGSPGALVASFPGQGGCDEAWYNPGNNKYFTACRQANPGPAALFVIDAAGFGVQRLFTGNGSNAHSVASDPVTFAAYVPTSSAATSGLCSSKGAVDANGCILVYTPGPASTVTATHDFNADGDSDILWQQTAGQVAIWLMNGTSVIGGGSPGSAGAPWSIVGQRDFNGDGKADILWRNGMTGLVEIWFISGSTVIGGGSPGTVTTDWSIVGTGDFNGDGKGDILWLNTTTGQVLLWFLNGSTVIGGGSPGTAPSGYTVAGVGDFNGDGFADILWRNNSTGQTLIWLLNGATLLSSGSPGTVATTFVVAGTGDFNADHRSDILWYNTMTGQVVIWLMNGTTVTGGGSPGSAASPWAIQETGDFNGDGMSDILWRNTSTGTLEIWFISGSSVIGGGSPGIVTLDWQVQTLNAD